MVKALILGITGQDGSYLADILLEKGYEVHGLIRRSSTGNTKNIQHIMDRIKLHKGDLADPTSIYRIINEVRPQEIYNEADQDNVDYSYTAVGYSCDITGAAVGRILEIIKQIDPKIKYFQPCTALMFGPAEPPQNENTILNPQNPYACAKAMAYYLVRYYRNTHGIFASTAIFYNHDSPRRTSEYLLHKITRAAVNIAMGKQKKLTLGSLDMQVDIGYAKEFMETAWKIMQLDKPDDFVIGTGNPWKIKQFVDAAFKQVNLDPEGLVYIDSSLIRPGKPITLIGNITKANKTFGFSPKITGHALVKVLMDHHKEVLGYKG